LAIRRRQRDQRTDNRAAHALSTPLDVRIVGGGRAIERLQKAEQPLDLIDHRTLLRQRRDHLRRGKSNLRSRNGASRCRAHTSAR
jgi:hypothetical protein